MLYKDSVIPEAHQKTGGCNHLPLAVSGALLAGSSVTANLSGELINSGAIAGRQLVSLTAENLKNLGGRITGATVDLIARTDLDNRGGRIDAVDRLTLQAGRDLNIRSTTRTQSVAQGSRTNIDRVAGLYVSGATGTLTAVAGRDAHFTAAEVVNAGRGGTTLAAGHNLTLGALQESHAQNIVWNKKNTNKQSTTADTGTVIRSGGDLALMAGNDLTAQALDLAAQGNASLIAGHDLTLVAGQRTQTIDQASYSQSQSKGFGGLGGTTRSARATYRIERSELVDNRLAGQNLTLQAGRDLSLEAGTLSAQDRLALTAGRDLTLTAAETHDLRSERQQISKRDNFGPGRQSLKTTRDESTVTPDVSQLQARDITLQAGRDLALVAPRVQADTLAATAGNQLTIAAATATHERTETSVFKTNRLNFSEVTAPLRGTNGVMNASGHPDDQTFVTGGRIKDKIELGQAGSQRRAVVADLDVRDIALQSGGDTTLVAPRIEAERLAITAGQIDGTLIDPEARIEILGVKESRTATSSKNSHSFVHETVRDGGINEETLLLADIRLPGDDSVSSNDPSRPSTQLALAAPGGIVIGATPLAPTQREQAASTGSTGGGNGKAPSGKVFDLKAQAQTLAQQPGLAWLGEVAQRDDVDWQKIELVRQSWDYKRSGLTAEGAAIVVIVVSILTWGAASGAGAAVAEGAGMTTTTVTAAGATTTTLTATGAAVAAATAAGLTTLASQAAVSLINNQGDVGKTLDDLGSQESIKQLVASMLTAGLAQGATQALQGAGFIGNPISDPSFGTRFANYATKAMIGAGVQSVVYGTPLSETAKTALITSLAQTLTSEIGDWGKSDSALVAKTLAHAVVQCAAASVQNKDCGSAALGAAVAEALSPVLDQLDDRTKAAGYQQTLGSSIAGMGAMLAASLTGQDAMTALNAAQMVDYYNRQLHPDEQALAKRLATASNGKYTEKEVADALRWADNNKLGETRLSNTTVVLNENTQASEIYDAGSMSLASGNGQAVLYQDMSKLSAPSSGLMSYIQQQTGATYSWDTTVWQASPGTPYDNTRYATVSANGNTFSVPLADCPAAGCANGGSIAWATTNEKDKASLAAYAAALDQDAKRAAAYAAGTPIMVAGVALGGVPIAGQVVTGAAIGSGVNYAAQTQLNDGNINTSEVIMGGITGGLTMGRSLIPTVLINTGGAMNTSAFLNDNIDASMAGAAIGSTLGWGTGYLVEGLGQAVARRLTGDAFWQTSKGFSSDLIEMPYGITAPVSVIQWPARIGATAGALTQEISGDKIKKNVGDAQ